jgi:hypothetical protein
MSTRLCQLPRRTLFCGALSLALSAASGLLAADARADGDKPATVATVTLDSLFSDMVRAPGFYARFHEEKQIALLIAPVKNDGTIHFEKKRGLARHTTAPQKQSVLLSSGALTLWDGQKTETISLRSSASLRALAEAFGLMLAADRAGLERNFSLAFEPKAGTSEWTLKLTPLSADLKTMVLGIEINGNGTTPKLLRVREASGDVSTTTFTDVDSNKRYTDAEAAAVFKVPPGSGP